MSSGYELTKKLRTTKKLRVRMKRRIEPKKKPRAMKKQTAGMKRAELGKKLRTLQQKRRMTVWKKAAKRTVQRELRKDEEEQALHVDFGSSELWEGLLSKTEEYPWDVCSRDEAVAEVSRKRKERKKKRTKREGKMTIDLNFVAPEFSNAKLLLYMEDTSAQNSSLFVVKSS